MQLRADIQLQTAIRALTEVVAPALDAGNALAVEQLQIVIGMLHLMATRLPLQFRYDCDELARLLEFCRALTADIDDDAHGEAICTLGGASTEGAAILARAQADPAEILRAIRDLRTFSGALITAVYRDGSDAARTRITDLALAHADQQLLRERAWVAPQGWETQPEELPAITDLLK